MKIKILSRTAIHSQPDPVSRQMGSLEPGFVMDVANKVNGVAIGGNANWYQDANGFCYWAGDVIEVGLDSTMAQLPSRLDTSQTSKLGWGGKQFGIEQVWSRIGSRGAGVKVAILDLGIDLKHVELKGLVANGNSQNILNPAKTIQDVDGHGTRCAGVIVAQGRDQMLGIAPAATLLVGKLKNGRNDLLLPATLAAGIDWAVQQGAKVISISQGVEPGVPDVMNPVLDGAIDRALAANVCIVAAIGNGGQSGPAAGGWPGKSPKVISVAAVDASLLLAQDSDRNPGLTIAAPGVNVLTTNLTSPSNAYATASGSSLAAPFVAAVIALVLAHRPDLDVTAIRKLITDTALSKTTLDGAFSYKVIQPLEIFNQLNPVIV